MHRNQLESDLSLNCQQTKGFDSPVRNCWHFYTNGNNIDALFYDTDDFCGGMNRIFTTLSAFNVIILAFCLMDTHIHFVLYGTYDECNRFIQEYLRKTSMHIARRHKENHKLVDLHPNYQAIDTISYLKTVICYTIKNPPVGGLPYTAYDYPWSSGSLYFRNTGLWTSPMWTVDYAKNLGDFPVRERRKILGSGEHFPSSTKIMNGIVFPGEYVATEITEKIFRTQKVFNYFMCITKESDIESRGGTISLLRIPDQELRQHRKEECRELFDVDDIRSLNTEQRLRLARKLRFKYNCSVKQISRACGLVFTEIKDLL